MWQGGLGVVGFGIGRRERERAKGRVQDRSVLSQPRPDII